MITVVNEPLAEYNVTGWQTEYKDFSVNDFICGIENETVLFCQPSGFIYMPFFEKPKRKLSALRGKLSKQSGKELEELTSKLREEWERDF